MRGSRQLSVDRPPPRRARRALPLWAALGAAVLAFLAGWGVAASATVVHGTEHVSGIYEAETDLAYWTNNGTYITTMPSPVPSLVSTSAAAPTVLPSSPVDYTLNAGTAGHPAVRWDFTENASAPASTEIEIEFNVSAGTGPVSTVKVFVETQATAPASPLTIRFFFDSGTTTPGPIFIRNLVDASAQCSAIGTCP
jgi:hypothetical protein